MGEWARMRGFDCFIYQTSAFIAIDRFLGCLFGDYGGYPACSLAFERPYGEKGRVRRPSFRYDLIELCRR